MIYYENINNNDVRSRVEHFVPYFETIKNLLKRCFYGFLFNICFGVNYFYIFLNKEKKSLNDIWSNTKVIRSD